ncbi:MAG TPA: hypothetical protein VGW38_12645 [Chloroflexota bacterium]|nr:hypothetical protein [Chloroflexota bacterium]
MSIYDASREGNEVPDEVLERLKGVTTATAWGILQAKGIKRPFMMGVRPLSVDDVYPLVGRARTLRYVPLREDLLPFLREAGAGTGNPQREAIESVQPGDVLVVDGMGNLEAATMGDILASRIKARGAAGIVADGCVRDSQYIKRMGIPVFTRSVHPAANTSAILPYSHNDIIQCGGVTVVPGDILLGDEEGVIVIPRQFAAEIADVGVEREAKETFQRQKILEGLPIQDVYPTMNPQVQAEYDAAKGLK